ncbi:unnamed protein product [Mytilus edulis]|uniref:Uncharacterized protein n=1 Tax=Mytilus edulis TaxID=6550 RepID=A0A8S3PWP4_MYTED|nr:unnamed protein product [Mytilus edulis]
MTKLFRCFMVSEIEVNKRTKYGIYPLQVSILLNSVEMTKWVLQHDADVNIVDDLKNAPLTIALENEDVDMVQLLLDAKAKVNFINHIRSETDSKIQDKHLEDSLLTRVITGSANTKAVLVKMLLQAGADPNIAVKATTHRYYMLFVQETWKLCKISLKQVQT